MGRILNNSMNDNRQIYNEYVIGLFNRAASSYDRVGPRFFSYFGNRLVELAEVSNGASVLDVGCGRGEILFPSAEKVGTLGQVVGIDFAEEMVQQTASEVESRQLLNAQVRIMDAETLTFPDASFDFVFWGFALYEFYDPTQALLESFRVLRPGGVFGVSVWGKKLDARWNCVRSVWRAYRSQRKPEPSGGISGQWDSTGIKAFLSNAGFTRIQIIEEEKEFFFKDEEEWWLTEWSHGNRSLYERLDPSVLEQHKRELLEAVGQLRQDEGIPIIFQMLLIRADKPKG